MKENNKRQGIRLQPSEHYGSRVWLLEQEVFTTNWEIIVTVSPQRRSKSATTEEADEMWGSTKRNTKHLLIAFVATSQEADETNALISNVCPSRAPVPALTPETPEKCQKYQKQRFLFGSLGGSRVILLTTYVCFKSLRMRSSLRTDDVTASEMWRAGTSADVSFSDAREGEVTTAAAHPVTESASGDLQQI